jgi:hypothetical protein
MQRVATPDVPRPTQDSDSSEEVPQDAIRHDSGESRQIAATPIVTTPTEVVKSTEEEPQDVVRHNTTKRRPREYYEKSRDEQRNPQNTSVENGYRASRRQTSRRRAIIVDNCQYFLKHTNPT